MAGTGPVLRPFRPTAADYAALAAISTAVDPEVPASAEFTRRQDGERAPEEVPARLFAEVGGRPVGFAQYGAHPFSADPRRCWFELGVEPGHRWRGLGAALYERAMAELAGRRPVAWETAVWEHAADGVRFVEKRGYRCVQRNPTSALDPAAFDPAPFAAAGERMAAAGVVARTLGELMAEDPDWREKLYELHCDVERDVPWHGETTRRPFAEWAAAFDDNPDLVPDGHLVALDGDRYVGMTQLWASQATDRLLFTGLTGVRRSHRRLGIATALKVRSILHAATLCDDRGRAPRIVTGNEESNPMLELNLRLGFVEVRAQLAYVREREAAG